MATKKEVEAGPKKAPAPKVNDLMSFLEQQSHRGRQSEDVPPPILAAAKAAKSFAAFKIALGTLLKSDQRSFTYLSERVKGKDIKNVVRYIYLSARKA